jgi:hypothetical protein
MIIMIIIIIIIIIMIIMIIMIIKIIIIIIKIEAGGWVEIYVAILLKYLAVKYFSDVIFFFNLCDCKKKTIFLDITVVLKTMRLFVSSSSSS